MAEQGKLVAKLVELLASGAFLFVLIPVGMRSTLL